MQVEDIKINPRLIKPLLETLNFLDKEKRMTYVDNLLNDVEQTIEETRDMAKLKNVDYKTALREIIITKKPTSSIKFEISYHDFEKSLMDSMTYMFKKGIELSTDPTPEKYKEFYNEWLKIYQDKFKSFSPILTSKSNKEILEKLLSSFEESNKLCKSWIAQLEKNSQKTDELIQDKLDPTNLEEIYDNWINLYAKKFDEFFTFLAKSVELSPKDVSLEAYKEFYDLWMNAFQKTHGRYYNRENIWTSKEFAKKFYVTVKLCKSWITTNEEISQKTKDISKQTSDPEAYTTFYNCGAKLMKRDLTASLSIHPQLVLLSRDLSITKEDDFKFENNRNTHEKQNRR